MMRSTRSAPPLSLLTPLILLLATACVGSPPAPTAQPAKPAAAEKPVVAPAPTPTKAPALAAPVEGRLWGSLLFQDPKAREAWLRNYYADLYRNPAYGRYARALTAAMPTLFKGRHGAKTPAMMHEFEPFMNEVVEGLSTGWGGMADLGRQFNMENLLLSLDKEATLSQLVAACEEGQTVRSLLLGHVPYWAAALKQRCRDALSDNLDELIMASPSARRGKFIEILRRAGLL